MLSQKAKNDQKEQKFLIKTWYLSICATTNLVGGWEKQNYS